MGLTPAADRGPVQDGPHEGARAIDRPATVAVSPELVAWARLPGSAELLRQARGKLERGARGDRVTVAPNLDVRQRRDVSRLMGRRWEVSGTPVTLGRLRAAVATAAAGADDGAAALDALLERTSGPLRDRPAERKAAAMERASHRRQVMDALEGAGVPAGVRLLALQRRWFGDGPASVAQAGKLARLLDALSSGTSGLLAEVATALYADPHALDRDTSLGRTAVRVLAAARALQAGVDADQVAAAADAALVAARWRQVWQTTGVVCDRVSATVLVLNLPLAGDASAAAISAAVAGEPLWLTGRSLAGSWGPGADVRVVRVCENPSVVEAAADELGASCPPLVCTYGRPSTAAHALLACLHAAGVHLLVSADRDGAGRQIAGAIQTMYPGTQAWGSDLVGMYEEERLPGLLADLASAARGSQTTAG